MKTLTRDQMKNVYGGDGPDVPQNPGGDGGESSGGYKCCWTGTTNCSICVPGGYPSCVTGASPISC